MRSFLVRLSSILWITVVALAQGAPRQSAGSTGDGKAPAADTSASRPAPKFDIANVDKSLDPCVDFYQYACANWIKNNTIPPDYSDWLSFNEVYEHNLAVLHNILEKASAHDPKRSPVMQKIGDFYAACMDETAVNKAGSMPLKPELDRIAAIKDKTQMIEAMSHEQLIGPNPPLGFGSAPHLHDADMA